MERVDPFENNSCLAEGTSTEDNLYQLKYGVKYSEIVSNKTNFVIAYFLFFKVVVIKWCIYIAPFLYEYAQRRFTMVILPPADRKHV